MAGTPVPEETPELGWKATVAGVIFALAVLGGFSAATAASYDGDKGHDDDHGEEHSDEHDDGEDHSEGEEHSE